MSFITHFSGLFHYDHLGGDKLLSISILSFLILSVFSDVRIFCFWSERSDANLSIADMGSKKSHTDEWSLDNASYSKVISTFGLVPSLDTFASPDNAKCDRFYSKLPETNTSGVNFFNQTLDPSDILYVCPPVNCISRAWRTITRIPGLTSIVVVPYWRSHAFFADFLEKDQFKSCVKSHFIFDASFTSKSDSCLFNGSTKFATLAMLVITDTTK